MASTPTSKLYRRALLDENCPASVLRAALGTARRCADKHLLERVVSHPNLDSELRAELAMERSMQVRSMLVSRADMVGDELDALLDTETRAGVWRELARRTDLPAHVYEAMLERNDTETAVRFLHERTHDVRLRRRAACTLAAVRTPDARLSDRIAGVLSADVLDAFVNACEQPERLVDALAAADRHRDSRSALGVTGLSPEALTHATILLTEGFTGAPLAAQATSVFGEIAAQPILDEASVARWEMFLARRRLDSILVIITNPDCVALRRAVRSDDPEVLRAAAAGWPNDIRVATALLRNPKLPDDVFVDVCAVAVEHVVVEVIGSRPADVLARVLARSPRLATMVLDGVDDAEQLIGRAIDAVMTRHESVALRASVVGPLIERCPALAGRVPVDVLMCRHPPENAKELSQALAKVATDPGACDALEALLDATPSLCLEELITLARACAP